MLQVIGVGLVVHLLKSKACAGIEMGSGRDICVCLRRNRVHLAALDLCRYAAAFNPRGAHPASCIACARLRAVLNANASGGFQWFPAGA